MKTFYWLVKREFWEHRGGFFWAPVITGGVYVLLNIMGIVAMEVIGRAHGWRISAGDAWDHMVSNMHAGDFDRAGHILDILLFSSTVLVGVVMGVVVFFYCLGALYDDRRDRSILFWRSLPVSDTATVLSKVASALLLAPAIAFVVGLVAGLVQLLVIVAALSLHNLQVWQLLTLAHPLTILGHLLAYLPVYMLSALPTVGWLMFCSAWARSKPFLWAVVVPVAASMVLGWFGMMRAVGDSTGWFWRHVLIGGLLRVFPSDFMGLKAAVGGPRVSAIDMPIDDVMNPAYTWAAMGSMQLWIGVAVGLALLAGAVWFRRVRDDA